TAATNKAQAPAPQLLSAEKSASQAKAIGITTARLDAVAEGAKAAIDKSLSYLDRMGAAPKSFLPTSVDADSLGMTHVRFERFHEGVRVFGEQVVTHLGVGLTGDVASMTGSVEPLPLGLGGSPAISTKDAVASARKTFEGRPKESAVERCIFFGADGVVHSGYHVQLVDLSVPNPRRMSYLVDGEKGAIIQSWNQIGGVINPEAAKRMLANARNITPAGAGKAGTSQRPQGAADDKTMYSGMVEIFAKQNGNTYVLDDGSRGKGLATKDAKNQSRAGSAVEVTDNNNVWGETGDNARQVSAVDAHYGAQMTYDTYKNILGIDSIDLKGYRLVSNVHIGRNYVNAFWDGSQMNYGDGDGKTAGPLTTLDIAGHEITHGLTTNTANLIYSGESGGLNEAMSDIGGFLVEWYASQHNPGVKWEWTMGEDCWTPTNGNPNDGLRYMNNPTKDGYSVDHYSKYPQQTEVHGSSGIANCAFYQLAEENLDGKKDVNSISKRRIDNGIGVDKAAKIFFRALMHYMTSRTNFAGARKACIQAATDLFGADSVEVKKTKEAWSVVGVEDKAV
ncbi:MAG: M4 family metallopeptidase, partial [Myxococcota bacterium]